MDRESESAACRVVDSEIFFPIRGGSSKAPRHVCAQCSVRPQCLMYAIDNCETYGIWGGTSDIERRLLRHAIRDNDPTPVLNPIFLRKQPPVWKPVVSKDDLEESAAATLDALIGGASE